MSTSATRAILWGGLAAGVLDIAAVFAFWLGKGVGPLTILQSIATSVLGREAFELGALAAIAPDAARPGLWLDRLRDHDVRRRALVARRLRQLAAAARQPGSQSVHSPVPVRAPDRARCQPDRRTGNR